MTVLFDVAPVEHALDSILASAFPAIDLSPVILLQNATSRASRADELAAVLRDVDEACSEVARLESRLKQLSLRLHFRRSAVSTAMAPVTGLPIELLQKIFVHVAESDRTSKARIVLSHVSSSWRDASLGLQELWTIIQVPYRHPDMFHEFARRSGRLRLELSTLSDWPQDLELDRSEASRLAVIIFMSMPTQPLLSSAQKFKDLIRLSKFVASARFLSISGVSAYMLNSKTIEIIGSHIPFHWMPPFWLHHLVSLTLRRAKISEVNYVFSHLDVPLLREVDFEDMYGTHESSTGSEDDSDAEDDGPAEISLSGLEKQITCLNISCDHREVLWQMCDNFVMPSLTSLSIHFKSDRVTINTLEKLSHLLSTCPQLEYLELSVGTIALYWLERLWKGGVVPRLRSFCLLNHGHLRDEHPAAEHLTRVIASRGQESEVEPLRQLIVSRCFVRESDEEELREAVGELVIIDS